MITITQTHVYMAILCILVIYAAYIFLYYRFDEKRLSAANTQLKDKLRDDSLQKLLNGSGINNLPNLEIITNNTAITTAASCNKEPVLVPEASSDAECIRLCANSTAHHIQVDDGETYIYNSQTLSAGSYCTIAPRPMCNMMTSIALMTVNSVVCRPRNPELIGGMTGNTVVACNDNEISDPRNQLWDYKTNSKFDAPNLLHTIADINERLDSGEFRYRCVFNGYDERQNPYIQHPQNRFHPFRNYCASEVYQAHPDVKTVWNDETKTFTCDCGDFETTRVKNINPDDPTSYCASKSFEITTDVRNKKTLTQPYRCFNLFSNVSDVGRYLPCPSDQFTRQGSEFTTVKIPFTHHPTALIEHPRYADFNEQDAGVKLGDGSIIWDN